MHVKNSSFNKESGHELLTKINDTIAETLSVRKRMADTLTTEKQSKSIRQGLCKTKYIERGSPF